MLKRDKEDFLSFVSGDPASLTASVASLNAREKGHFEDHPLSAKLIKENVEELLAVWSSNSVAGARDWVLQFVADAGVADSRVKPIIISALSDKSCDFLPTVLYTMSTSPALFEDCGDLLIGLAEHPDREVRWRVAYFISKVRNKSQSMLSAIELLKKDRYDTTQVYVRACCV